MERVHVVVVRLFNNRKSVPQNFLTLHLICKLLFSYRIPNN
jgi:hypothetical protein